MRKGSGRTAAIMLFLCSALFLSAAGCGNQTSDENVCPAGKCDGLSDDFRDLFSDMGAIDLNDLLTLGSHLITKQVGDLLSNIPFADVKIVDTEVYGTAAEAEGDHELHSIDALQAGLLARYGDKAFVSQVNALRSQYLQDHPGSVFAESAFRLDARFDHAFNFSALGFDGRIGLDARAGIEARIISPYSGERSSLYGAPIDAIKAVRGFALPRDLNDIRQMAPGETVSLAGFGGLMASAGIGLPIYITTVADVATLHAVFSAGGHVRIGGRVDIQLVRGADQTAFVDVGVTGENERKFRIALETKWGVEGVLDTLARKTGSPDPHISIAGASIDLGKYADRALERLLNKRLKVFSIEYKKEKLDVRHTVARFSFDLSRNDDKIKAAMAQALRGDIRLAQALANRQGSGVVKMLDFDRDVESRSKYFGGEFLGLRFYRLQEHYKGTVTISEGNLSQELLFDSVEDTTKVFLGPKIGHNRTSLVSIRRENGRYVGSNVNLRVGVREKDDNTERWQILGHVDHLLAFFIGQDKLDSHVSYYTDALERFMNTYCNKYGSNFHNERRFRKCYTDHEPVHHSWTLDTKTKASNAFNNLIASGGLRGGMDPAFTSARDMATALWNLKMQVQSTLEYPATWTGPESNMYFEYRIGTQGIEEMFIPQGTEDKFAQALRDTMKTALVDFRRRAKDWREDRDEDIEDMEDDIQHVKRRFMRYQDQYRRLHAVATASYQSDNGTVHVGDGATLMIIDGEEIDLETVAERKGQIVAAFFDKIRDKSDDKDLGKRGYQTAAYAILRMVQPSMVELLLHAKFDSDKYTDHSDINLYARGANAGLISAGRFDLHALTR